MTFTPSMRKAMIGDRLAIVRQRLIAIEGAVRMLAVADELRYSSVCDAQIGDMIADDIGRCDDELTWLENLPERVLSLPAPTVDEADEMKRAAGKCPRAIKGRR